MNTLADFLNHGTLPFTGRAAEVARIVSFWRGTFEATQLRVMLLTGEAGIGKSRLLDHAVRLVVEAGGSVVHVKLYPESTAPFMSLVARALWHPEAGRAILGEEPEAKLIAVGSAMQRLSRLRPTLFVLEDLHLLGSEGLPALARLLKLLADETISVLALVRPVELEARGGLEPYLVEEFILKGFEPAECAMVWEEVSGSVINPELAAVLHDATAGNPLALRSALRSALKSKDEVHTRLGNRWITVENAGLLASTLKRTVGMLADGMTAHLSKEELAGAKRLASLGEVFSREAAAIMLENAEPILGALLFKGIFATPVAPPDPLVGETSSRLPLGFTHTLLHRQLIDDPCFETDRLIRVIADSPLYSILPFRLLSQQGALCIASLDIDIIRRAFDRTIRVQIAINRGPQWRMAEHTWKAALRMTESRLGIWDCEDWERMIVRLVNHRLNLVRREPLDVRRYWLEHLSSITAGASSDELATGRFYALFNRILLLSEENLGIIRESWAEAEELIAGRPQLCYTLSYADYLIAACVGANDNNDQEMMRLIGRRADEILASDDLPEPVRVIFEQSIRPPLLKLYDNEEELRARLAHVAQLERTVEKSNINVWTFCIDLLAEVAEVERLTRVCDATIPLMREQQMIDLLCDAMARQQCVISGICDSLSPAMEAVENALAGMPQWRREQIQSIIVLPLIDAALLRGEPDHARTVIERYGVADPKLKPVQWVMLAITASDPIAALKAGRESGCREDRLAPIIDLVIGNNEKDDYSVAETMLRAPVLRLDDVLSLRVVAGLIDICDHRNSAGSVPPELRDLVGTALVRVLEWLAAPERELFIYMRPILEHEGKYIGSRKVAYWQKKIDEIIVAHHDRQRTEGSDGRLRLSMLGTIVAHTADGQQQRFQGARARMLLATMVINQMLKEPLSSSEFCRIAAGSEVVEIEKARDVVRTTVHRIRELIGRDMILTDGPTPRLNIDLMHVDLLEVRELLKRASETLRRSSPMQAQAALMAALEIMGGEVLFPSLFDDFIEAVREDFESELRTTVIDVAQALISEGGIDSAAEVLRRASDMIPGDEDLTQQLRDVLLQAGRRADAERARMRAEVE